uniref:Uncharacterized protein n=1 Tax=Oryza punctata TaxID=4537 RepID=A0A0E0LHG5_ORYPU
MAMQPQPFSRWRTRGGQSPRCLPVVWSLLHVSNEATRRGDTGNINSHVQFFLKCSRTSFSGFDKGGGEGSCLLRNEGKVNDFSSSGSDIDGILSLKKEDTRAHKSSVEHPFFSEHLLELVLPSIQYTNVNTERSTGIGENVVLLFCHKIAIKRGTRRRFCAAHDRADERYVFDHTVRKTAEGTKNFSRLLGR